MKTNQEINKIISWTEPDNLQCEALLYDGTNQEQFIAFGLKYGKGRT